ncbi:MAG TPA: MFS transporter [Gammaproteobacteria bacterium]|nr:MFS transporter [Gammaproteobacteria bacterium]
MILPEGGSVAQTINVADVIDGRRIGGFEIRTFLLCAGVLFADGFDVQGITYVAPAISQEWGLARGAFGPTFSAGLLGVLLGAIFIAPLADRIGRRRVVIGACVAFGLCTLATLLAGSLSTLLPIRLVTGLGLGAAIPNAIALASEYAPKRWRATTVMFVASGLSVGSVVAGVAASRLIPTVGWHGIFVIGGVLPLLLAAALGRWLPESLRFLAALPAREADARRLLAVLTGAPVPEDARVTTGDAAAGKATVVDLFKEQRARSTVLLWIAFFMSLLNVYLTVNWLPTSLNASGFSLSDAALLTSIYHSGGVAGIYVLGLAMDRVGAKPILIAAFVLAAAGFYTFATVPGLSVGAMTAVLIATGFGVVGAQGGINTITSMIYPVAMRSTGLGWALGVGRVGSIVGPTIGGMVLASAADPRSAYLVCIVPALVGAVCVALLRWRSAVPRAAAASATQPT